MATTDPVAEVDVPVLVIGGSLVGLATSMFLAQHGVDVLSVEKHHGTAIHPRAGYFHLRTIELMRVAGIEARVRGGRRWSSTSPMAGSTRSRPLAGKEIASYIPNINAGRRRTSARLAGCSCRNRCSSRSCSSGPRARRPLRVLHRAGLAASRTRRRDGDGPRRPRRRRAHDPGAVPRRLRRQPQPDPREPRHRRCGATGCSRGASRSTSAPTARSAAGPEPGRDLRHQPAAARLLPAWRRPGSAGFLVVFTVGDINEPGARFVADIVHRRDRRADGPRARSATPTSRSTSRTSTSGAPSPTSRTRSRPAGCSWPATPPTPCRPPAASAATPASRTPTTWPGSSRSCCKGQAGPALLDTLRRRAPARRRAGGRAGLQPLRDCGPTPISALEGMHEAIPDMHVEFNRYRSTAVVPDADYVDDGAPDIDPRQSLRPSRHPGAARRADARRQDDLDPRPVHGRLRADGRARRRGVGRCRRSGDLGRWCRSVSYTVGPNDGDFCAAYGVGPSGAIVGPSRRLCSLAGAGSHTRCGRPRDRRDASGARPDVTAARVRRVRAGILAIWRRNKRGGRSILATLVGYFLVGIIILVLFHAVVGTVLWLFRTVVIIVLLLGLVTLYFRLKSPDD